MSLMGQKIYARLRNSWAKEADPERKAFTERRMSEVALQYKLQVNECALPSCQKPIIAGQSAWMSGEDRYCGPRCWMHHTRAKAKAREGKSIGVDRESHGFSFAPKGSAPGARP